MKNALFSWIYPNVRQEGGPLNAAEILGAEIAIRVQGAPEYTVLGTVDYPALSFRQNDMAPGNYEARCVVLTDTGQRGEPAYLEFAIADESPAVAVSDFGVEFV